MRHYTLENGKPVPCDMMTWVMWFEKTPIEERRVDLTEIAEGISVSTVFLGMNYNFNPEGVPLVYETMIFGGECDEYQWRYATLGEAKAGHWAAVELARNALKTATEQN